MVWRSLTMGQFRAGATQSFAKLTPLTFWIEIGAATLWSGVLETHRFKGRCTTKNLAAVPRGVAKRFELSTGLRETFPKLTTVTRDEAANMVAAGKVRNEADGWKSQPTTDQHTGCWDVQLWQEITKVDSLFTVQLCFSCKCH